MAIFLLVVFYVLLIGGGWFVTALSTIGWSTLNNKTNTMVFDRSGWFEEFKLFLSLVWGLIILVLFFATILVL